MSPDDLPHDGEDPQSGRDPAGEIIHGGAAGGSMSEASTCARPSFLATHVPEDEGVVLLRFYRATSGVDSAERLRLQDEESRLKSDIKRHRAAIAENFQNLKMVQDRLDKLIDARNDAIEEVRKYYAGLYGGAGDSDVPDVHEAVRQIADEPPVTRDASHDAETTATTRDAGPEPEPDARSVDFERLVDQAEEPRKVIGSAMDVSDEDLAEARARDALEAAEGQPAMWMGYAIHELEAELTQDPRGYEKAFLVAREEWQNEKLRREAGAAEKKPDPVAT